MRFLLVTFLLAFSFNAYTQDESQAERPAADPADVSSVDTIINAVYETLSGPIRASEALGLDDLSNLEQESPDHPIPVKFFQQQPSAR